MNGAYRHDNSNAGRFAAVVKALLVRFKERQDSAGGSGPDNVDIEQAIKPFMALWELDIRIDEARTSHSHVLTERVKELAVMKAEAEMAIPKEFQL